MTLPVHDKIDSPSLHPKGFRVLIPTDHVHCHFQYSTGKQDKKMSYLHPHEESNVAWILGQEKPQKRQDSSECIQRRRRRNQRVVGRKKPILQFPILSFPNPSLHNTNWEKIIDYFKMVRTEQKIQAWKPGQYPLWWHLLHTIATRLWHWLIIVKGQDYRRN